MAEIESKDTALLVHIKHSKPIEVSDFVKTLNAIGGLFDDFVASNGDCEEVAKAKLYVEKIEKGSIDIHLTEVVSAALIPFAENVNTIIDFAKHIKGIVDYYANGLGEKPSLSARQLKNAHDMFSINAKDIKGDTSICAIDKNNSDNTYNNCTFNYFGSNSGQNVTDRDMQELKGNEERNIYKNQLMKIYQVHKDNGKDVGNKAVIDNIAPHRQIGLTFENDELRKEILHSDKNPLNNLYIVDVVTMTVNGKLAAYKVIALHDVLDGIE